MLKNPFAPISAPGSEAKYASFVVFWPCLWAHLDRRPGQQRLFQHAEEFSEVHLKGCAKSDELVILWPSSAALSSRLMTSTARLSSTAGLPAAAATPRSEGLGGGTRISRGGVVDAFTRDLELMEVIAAADAVVNARGSGGRGGLVGTRLLLDNPNGRSCRSRNRGGTRSLFSRPPKEGW
jgi:hypothetical protein